MCEKNKTQEKLAEKAERLAKELEAVKGQIDRCNHQFSAPMRATREYMEPVFDHYEGHGSDPEPVYRWYPKTESGWERICRACGYKQYTTKLKPTAFGADFGDEK